MNRRWLAGLLTAAMACCLWHGCGAAETGEIRLRVIARDDSAAAQAEKLLLRDAVIAACPGSCHDPDALLPMIQSIAAHFAPCQVDVRLWTPGGVPPAPTVYLVLGGGNGQNWWGVLYRDALLWARTEEEDADPPDREKEEPTAAAEEETPPAVEFVWPLLNWLRGLLGL